MDLKNTKKIRDRINVRNFRHGGGARALQRTLWGQKEWTLKFNVGKSCARVANMTFADSVSLMEGLKGKITLALKLGNEKTEEGTCLGGQLHHEKPRQRFSRDTVFQLTFSELP